MNFGRDLPICNVCEYHARAHDVTKSRIDLGEGGLNDVKAAPSLGFYIPKATTLSVGRDGCRAANTNLVPNFHKARKADDGLKIATGGNVLAGQSFSVLLSAVLPLSFYPTSPLSSQTSEAMVGDLIGFLRFC